jgi:molybdopterin-guanine dinucleotide biosynthesis protein A
VRLYDGDRARTVRAATAGQLDVPVTACGETVAPHGILPAWFPLVAGDEVAAER